MAAGSFLELASMRTHFFDCAGRTLPSPSDAEPSPLQRSNSAWLQKVFDQEPERECGVAPSAAAANPWAALDSVMGRLAADVETASGSVAPTVSRSCAKK